MGLSAEYWRAVDLTAESLREIFSIYYSMRWKRELCLLLGVRYWLGTSMGELEGNNVYNLIVKLFNQFK